MKLIIIASVIGVCAAARLEHLEPGYLPPGSQGSASFASTGPSGFDGSNNGLNKGSGSLGGSFQSRSGASGGDAFGASSSSSPQFSSRNNFENIPQQAFDEETGYQYGPGVNNFRTAGASSGNQFGDASPSSSNLVQALNSRFNAPSKPEMQLQQFNDANNFKTASAPSQPAFPKNQFGVTGQSSSKNAQNGVNSRFNAPNQQPQQFNGEQSQTQQTDDNNDDDSISIQGQDHTSLSKGPSTRYQSTQSNQAQSGVNSRFNTPSQQQPQQFNGQDSHNQQTVHNNDDDSDFNQGNQDQPSKAQGPSTRYQSTQSGSNKEQSGVNSRFNAPSQQQPQRFNTQLSQNQQSEDNDDDNSVSNQRHQGQAVTAQRPSTRYQPEQSEGNTFNQQNRGQEIRTQSNLGKQFAGRPAASSQFEVQSGSNQQFDSHSQPGFDRDSNTDASQTQSLTSRFNAPNEQFAAASQQIGANNAAGRQFGRPKSQNAEPNPFRNIPQQAFDEKTGYIY